MFEEQISTADNSGFPKLPKFDSDSYLGPDHIIEHLNENNTVFNNLLNLSWSQAAVIIEELRNNKDNVKPLFTGPDHVKEYDDYMYSTMADQYIDAIAEFTLLKISEIAQEKNGSNFSFSSIEFADRQDIDPPDWIGADHLNRYYDEIRSHWNSSSMPEPDQPDPPDVNDLRDMIELYLEMLSDALDEWVCKKMAEFNYASWCQNGCGGDWCCEFYAVLWELVADILYVSLGLEPCRELLCSLYPMEAECKKVINSSKSVVSKLIKDPGSFVSHTYSPSANVVNLLNEDNLESSWIKIANGVLSLEGRDSIDALSLTHAERFFEFLDIDWDGDLSTVLDLAKDNLDVLPTAKGYAAIRYALELPEFTDLDAAKIYHRLMKKDSV